MRRAGADWAGSQHPASGGAKVSDLPTVEAEATGDLSFQASCEDLKAPGAGDDATIWDHISGCGGLELLLDVQKTISGFLDSS